MGLILFILKIILIVFVVVLGVILLLLGLILLVPIHYEVKGNLGDSWEIQIKGKVTYLLSMVKLLFSYEKEQFDMNFFLFGFKKKKEESISETSIKDSSKTNLKQEDIEQFDKNETKVSEPITENENMSGIDEQKQTEVKSKKVKKQRSKETKLKKTKVRKNKIKKEKSKIDFAFIKQELTDTHNKSVVRKICSELLYLLRHFKFRKIVTDLRFSTGDPAFTGQVLGILCMIPMLYRYDFKIVPDFEEENAYIRGEFIVKGKVRLIHILIAGLRLFFDKEVRLVVKKIWTLLEK